MDRIFVPHPISDQTPEQLHAKADPIFASILLGLQSNQSLEVAAEEESSGEAAQECGS